MGCLLWGFWRNLTLLQWYCTVLWSQKIMHLNTLRPRQNGRHFADDIFKCILLNENVWIGNKIPMKFVPKGSINNIPSLLQIMAWRRPGDKPLSQPMMVSSLMHICVTRPQWVMSLNCREMADDLVPLRLESTAAISQTHRWLNATR